MNGFIKSLWAYGFCALLITSTVHGQSTLNFDVNGNGSLQTTNGTQSLPYQLAPDPTGGLSGWNVLTYTLLFSGFSGDVLLFNPSMQGNPLDCVIRFDGNANLIFYASSANGYNSLAATPGPPDPLFSNQINLNEANNGQIAYYTPAVGQPGYDVSNPSYIFYFNPSPVPEPGFFVLLFAGLGILALARLIQGMFYGRCVKGN